MGAVFFDLIMADELKMVVPRGIRLDGEALHLSPCLPEDWQTLAPRYRHRGTEYQIAVSQDAVDNEEKVGAASVAVDGIEQLDKAIHLVDDPQERQVAVTVKA